jgi:hypothetical protein
MHGADQARRQLRRARIDYLYGREGGGEPPLARAGNQGYLHSGKGSHVMYLLQERMGEAAVNRALKALLDEYRFKGAPYPRTSDLIAALRAEARTAEQQGLITDLFERVTFYDLEVGEPKAVRRADGKWEVSVPVVARKFYEGRGGEETEAPLAEAIEIGLFTAPPGPGTFRRSDVILLERRPLRSGRQVVTFVVDGKPTHAGVDPFSLYMDRDSLDNVLPVG